MKFLKRHRRFSAFFIISALGLSAMTLLTYSCNTSSYDSPITAGQVSAAALPPETLKTWTDGGVVNSKGYDQVVILDVNTSEANYNAGHIPGAHLLKTSDLWQTRQEGVAAVNGMVLDGAHMDALIQKYGIDQNTTVVFTTGSKKDAATGAFVSDYTQTIYATRAYWTFLYWGFPAEKLKLLDGTNVAWAALGYPITTEAPPTPAPSTYSVKNNSALRNDLRASVGEMIDVVDGKVSNAAIVDFRSGEADGSYAGKRGSTAGGFDPASDYVVFEGHMKGAHALKWTDLLDSANNYRFLPKEELIEKLATIGLDGTQTVYVH